MQRQPQMMPAQYRQGNYAQNPGQRQATMARGPGQMMPHQQAHSQQYAHPMAQQRVHQQRGQQAQPNAMRPAEYEQHMREQQARNRTDRPTDFNLPDGMGEVTLGDGVAEYKHLRDFEKRLDALMMRKDMEYQDRIKRRNKHYRKMRIWISNTVEGQYWQTQPDGFDFSNESNPTFKVRIHGKLHPEEPIFEQEVDEEVDPSISPSRSKLSHFFTQITVEYDQAKDLAPDGITAVEWVKPQGFHPTDPDLPANFDFDHFTFERKGDENVNLTINLHRDFRFGDGDESDTMYQLSDELAWIVMEKEATRDEVIERIFDYVKAEGLQQDDERRIIQCDERLRNIFNMNAIAFPSLPTILTSAEFKHLQPLKPIQLKYTIRTDEDFFKDPRPTVYDIMVPAEDMLRERLIAIREQNPDWVHNLLQIKELDKQLALVIQASHHHMARWKFFNNMDKDPVNFIRKWANSQRRDLEVILGDTASETGWTVETKRGQVPEVHWNYDLPGDEFRRGGAGSVWNSQGVREAVQLRLAKSSKIKGSE